MRRVRRAAAPVLFVLLTAAVAVVGWKAYQYRERAQAQDALIIELSKSRVGADYEERNREARAVASGQAVVFVGDSNVVRWPLAAHFPGKPTVARGIGGNTTADVLGRIGPDAVQLKAAGVVILAGTNDFLRGRDCGTAASEAADNLLQAASAAAQKRARVFVSSVLPLGLPTVTLPDCRTAIRSLNAALQARAGGTYLDLYSELAAADGAFKPQYSDDGIHPNEAGFAAMSKRLAAPVFAAD